MISFIDNIEYLITKHDCVIIPGWGAFIAQYSHAYINEQNQFISPKRTISFNASIIHNDGLLANSIMRKEKKTYESALSIISNEVAALKKQLHQGGEVAIGRIGFFTTNDESQICFEPYLTSMVCNDFFGLKPLYLCPLENIAKATNERSATHDNDNVVYLPISRNIFRIVASIVLLISLSFMLSTPIVLDNHQEYASLNILANKQKAIEEINSKTGDLYIAIPAEQSQKEVSVEKITTDPVNIVEPVVTTEAKIKSSNSPKFYIIVASLHTRKLAEQHIKNAKDTTMQILEKDGKYRIYVATTSTSDEAYAFISDSAFKAKHADAWVCRK